MGAGAVAGMPVAAGASGAVAAIGQAIKASGAIVRVGPEEFVTILSRSVCPLVIMSEGGFLSTNYQYLTSYKGLAFFTKSDTPLELTSDVEIVGAKKIWIPG